MKKLGVIGLGNPLRHDDGIGIVLLEMLQKDTDNSFSSVDFIDGGTGGMNLMHILARYKNVLIIDAVEFKGKPAETRVFTKDQVQSRKTPVKLSTHGSDFLHILTLSEQLGELPPTLLLLGVQPQDVSEGIGLSAPLQSVLDTLCSHVKKEIKNLINNQ